ncbi:hypothetical protein C4J81_13800 [Deltaproteobacteria bacterium Smac51]|nr:hypothetical protein C4J81_13800 [Deltaproteobacteria bacterium Smac51]
MKNMIVKIQRAIYPPNGPLLIYDRGREFVAQPKASKKVLKALGGDSKGYFEVTISQGNNIEIIRRIPDQTW